MAHYIPHVFLPFFFSVDCDCSPPVNGQRFNVGRAHPHCLPRNSLIMTSLQRASRTGKLKAKSGASRQDGRLPSSIARRARGEKDSRSSKGKGERATECCLGKIWQSTARGTAGVTHSWLRFVVSSDKGNFFTYPDRERDYWSALHRESLIMH